LGAGLVGSLLVLGGCNDESEQPGLEPAPTDRVTPAPAPPPTTPSRTNVTPPPTDLGNASPPPSTRPGTVAPGGSSTLPPNPQTTPVTPVTPATPGGAEGT
jgi:hypothetical protein